MVGLLLSKGEITLETIEMLAQFERDGIFLRDLIWNIQMWNNKDEEIVEIFIKFIRSIYNSDPNYFIEYFNQYDIMNIIV